MRAEQIRSSTMRMEIKSVSRPNTQTNLLSSLLVNLASSDKVQSLVDVGFPCQEGLSASLTIQTSDALSFSWLSPRSNSPFLPCILLSLLLDFGPNPGPWPDGSLRGRFLSVKTNDTAWVLLQPWWSQAAGPLYLYRNPRAGGWNHLEECTVARNWLCGGVKLTCAVLYLFEVE